MADFVLIEAGLASAALLPFAWHRLRVGYALRNGPLQPTQGSEKIKKIVWLLPVWNEELIIEAKLTNMVIQTSEDVEQHLHVIDSASTDSTVTIVEEWIENNPNVFASSKVELMEERLGKSAAVAKSLQLLKEKYDVIIMTDADARIHSNVIPRIVEWFSNPMIGAVGGTPNRGEDNQLESTHRNMFTLVRLGESIIDSTPFLEGSLLAFRPVVKPEDIAIGSNADDAQIATAVREYGLRAIQDPELCFTDQLPTTRKGRVRQRVRRAQGLQRLLLRKRNHWFGRTKFDGIMRIESLMHIVSPILMMAALVMMVARFAVMPFDQHSQTVLIIEGILILAWLSSRFERPLPLLRIPGNILVGMEHLLSSMTHALAGRSLHMWAQHKDARLAQYESES